MKYLNNNLIKWEYWFKIPDASLEKGRPEAGLPASACPSDEPLHFPPIWGFLSGEGKEMYQMGSYSPLLKLKSLGHHQI